MEAWISQYAGKFSEKLSHTITSLKAVSCAYGKIFYSLQVTVVFSQQAQ